MSQKSIDALVAEAVNTYVARMESGADPMKFADEIINNLFELAGAAAATRFVDELQKIDDAFEHTEEQDFAGEIFAHTSLVLMLARHGDIEGARKEARRYEYHETKSCYLLTAQDLVFIAEERDEPEHAEYALQETAKLDTSAVKIELLLRLATSFGLAEAAKMAVTVAEEMERMGSPFMTATAYLKLATVSKDLAHWHTSVAAASRCENPDERLIASGAIASELVRTFGIQRAQQIARGLPFPEFRMRLQRRINKTDPRLN